MTKIRKGVAVHEAVILRLIECPSARGNHQLINFFATLATQRDKDFVRFLASMGLGEKEGNFSRVKSIE